QQMPKPDNAVGRIRAPVRLLIADGVALGLALFADFQRISRSSPARINGVRANESHLAFIVGR
ncbi:MAG TPA: hypothetical protein VIT23_04900, partial [Terrimicrobiaceae bacterium]